MSEHDERERTPDGLPVTPQAIFDYVLRCGRKRAPSSPQKLRVAWEAAMQRSADQRGLVYTPPGEPMSNPAVIDIEGICALYDGDTPERTASVVRLFKSWHARGDGVAAYRNMALDSSAAGHRQFVSFGSEAAQIPCEGPPPSRLPDIGPAVNWAYVLEAYVPRTTQEESET